MSRLEQICTQLREDVAEGRVYRLFHLSNKQERRLLPSKCVLRSIRRQDQLRENVRSYLESPASIDKIDRVFNAVVATLSGSLDGDPSAMPAQLAFLERNGISVQGVSGGSRRISLVA